MLPFKLGTLEASEALLRDLYVDLRAKVNAWSQITNQTPQARMGYIGQHLVSVVTGFPGGKSGARGYDLVMGESGYGEIKTCYRVDQLGACLDCGAVVSSLETQCSVCQSPHISRKDDSKWLINIKSESELVKAIQPASYYFVLFEFAELNNPANNDIQASIWQVNPRSKGFAFCMIDYFFNIRDNSASKAPFNMWPYEFKFALTKPLLIYRALIRGSGEIETQIFPTLNNAYPDQLKPLPQYSRATTIKAAHLWEAISKLTGAEPPLANKAASLARLEKLRQERHIPNDLLCDVLAEAVYQPLVIPLKDWIPPEITCYYPELQ